MSYRCEHFKIYELVDKSTLSSLGEDKCWQLFPENFLICLDRLRDALGSSIIINNWKDGGQYSYSGYRPKTCSIGAPMSCHKRGHAFDLKVDGMKVVDVYNYIITHQAMFPEITRIEDINSTPSWLHIDCKPRDGWKGIKVFKP
jgi:hypothetical protein